MSQPQRAYHEHDHGVQDATFNELMVEQMRKTPWVLTSVAIHIVVALVLSAVQTEQRRNEEVRPIQAAAPLQDVIDEPKKVVEDVTADVEPEDKVAEEPVFKDTEISDHDETDDDEEWQDAKGEPDNVSHAPFDADQSGDVPGLGGGGGNAFGDRRGGSKNLRRAGGGGRTQKRVDEGLTWLKNHQSPDGRWDCDGFMVNGDPMKGPLCDGKGLAMHDVGVSGLALLAFLGAGETHRVGTFKDTVRKGLRWMKREQDTEGCFGSRGDPHFTYNHAIAALAMGEAYGMTKSAIWRGSAQKGIDYVMQCQNPYKAWRYGERPGDDDSSVTGWMVMALKSARMGGLDVSDTSFQWAHDFIEEVTDDQTGRTGYTKRGEPPVRAEGRLDRFPASESESLTAAGMLARIFCGEDPKDSPAIKAGAELLQKRLPVWDPDAGKVDMYYWYYGTLAMYQIGGDAWRAWNEHMKTAVVESQRNDGNYKGSWDPCGPWGEGGGRVYSTAVMTMCLEVYYRYGRVFGTR